MALYSNKQLKIERSKGLELSDAENKAYNSDGSRNLAAYKSYEWTNEEFEQWLSTKNWDNETKDHHRSRFKGRINFSNHGSFNYDN